MISEKSIQEVINTSQIEDVVQDYVTLKRRGSNMLGLCPFHDEKTPSFTVSPGKNMYKCFGCGKGGGTVNFLMEHDQLSFPESIRALARRYNITLEEDNKEDAAKFAELRKVEESYFLINDFALEYFQDNLNNTTDGKMIGLSYFKERGFIQKTVEKFQLGYALNQSKGLVTKALKKRYNETYLKELGLMSQKGYDFFRDRVMFPIHSVSGKVIGFAGRTLSTQKSQPKYINSPETPIYNKRKVLYGMHLAKSAINKKKNCLIVEGYTDVISLHQNGVENVVASSGTSLTQAQVRLIKRFTDNVTFLYDGDAAGVKAALRGLDIVLENGMNVSLVTLEEGEDPDSYVKKVGQSKFEEYLKEKAKDFIFFKMDLLLKDSGNDPIKKAEVINNIIGSIAKIYDSIKRSLYIRQCSQVLGVSENILVAEVNKEIRKNIKQKQIDQEREKRQAKKEASGKGYTPMPQTRPSTNPRLQRNGPTQGPPNKGTSNTPTTKQDNSPFPTQENYNSGPPMADSGFPTEEQNHSGPPPSGDFLTDDFPTEEPRGQGGQPNYDPHNEFPEYNELDDYPQEKVVHDQSVPSVFGISKHEYQEKDLARLVIDAGGKTVEEEAEGDTQDEPQENDVESLTIAELVHDNISDVFEYFDNPLYKRIIEMAYEYVKGENDNEQLTSFFVNHQEPELSQFTADALSSPYVFANWNNIGVYLSQKMPEENYAEDCTQLVLRFKFKKLEKIMLDLQKEMISPENSEEKKTKLLKVFRKLQIQKMELSKTLGVVLSF